LLPSLSRNQGLTVPQGASVILGPGALALSDPDTPPGRLVFVVQEPPRYGRLTLAGGGGGFGAALLASGSNFTQRQLEELTVAYRHDGGPAQIDRFTFTASDSTGRGFLLGGRLQTEPLAFTIQVESRKPYAYDNTCKHTWSVLTLFYTFFILAVVSTGYCQPLLT